MAGPERAFQDAVVDYAHLCGWIVAHFRNSRTGSGAHVTAVSYDGKGFPDLVLVRERVVFAEMKAPRGTVSPEQDAWAASLLAAGAEHYFWRPRDWPAIERILAKV